MVWHVHVCSCHRYILLHIINADTLKTLTYKENDFWCAMYSKIATVTKTHFKSLDRGTLGVVWIILRLLKSPLHNVLPEPQNESLQLGHGRRIKKFHFVWFKKFFLSHRLFKVTDGSRTLRQYAINRPDENLNRDTFCTHLFNIRSYY